jgi:uncharacterized protein (TIGR02453 family)
MEAKVILDFLKALKKNNNRDWFNENKNKYEAAKKELEGFLNQLIPAVKAFDKEVTTSTPKEAIFRIYRDVRFSNDKSPYKTNFGAHIRKGAKNVHTAGYYFHIEPGGCFIGGGIWMPEADILKAIRKEVYYNTAEFKKIINQKKFVEYFGGLDGEKLSKPPKDFPKDFKDIELLKYKSYMGFRALSDKELQDKNLLKFIVDILKTVQPLNKFINRGIEMKE